jgi:hypothetical protein
MRRKPANPVEIWRAYAGLGMLAFEAQAVVGMRLLGMSGAWPVGKGENRKMLSEKPPAFSKAANAAARKAASGGRRGSPARCPARLDQVPRRSM